MKIRSCLSLRPRAVIECDPHGDHFHFFSLHFTGYDRKKHDDGRCNYIPVNLGEIPDYYRRFMAPVDIVILKCCRMDDSGVFNFSASNLWHRAIIERAKTVIVELTDGNPYLFGEGNGVHVSEVDYIIEGDNQPAVELPNPPPTDVDRAVGKLIANEIEDGACLQIGIGGMPNAVCTQLLDSSARDLGIHTEMLTEGIIELYLAGATGAQGPVGSTGAQGAAGVSGYAIVTGTASADIEGARTVTATCASGKVAIGGGFFTTNVSSAQDTLITASYPSSTTVWTAVGTSYPSGGDQSYSLQAYVICATAS